MTRDELSKNIHVRVGRAVDLGSCHACARNFMCDKDAPEMVWEISLGRIDRSGRSDVRLCIECLRFLASKLPL